MVHDEIHIFAFAYTQGDEMYVPVPISTEHSAVGHDTSKPVKPIVRCLINQKKYLG
jgi:hypothetical protein